MTVQIGDFPRPLKSTIARAIHKNLSERAKTAEAEPALDNLLPALDSVAARLETHVQGKASADAARAAHAARAELADINVDTHTRHIESYLLIEASRREGPFVPAARALHRVAFPAGIAFVDDRIPHENAICRNTLAILRAPEHAPVLKGIQFPIAWLDNLEAALDESDTAFVDANLARASRGDHVGLGRDAEADWLDLMVRLRRYVESRASANDVEKQLESRALIAPLLDALAQAKATAATRATRRAKAPTSTTER